MKLISVILPVYNAEEFVYQAIASILSQTYTNFEFIIINDGSTDRSLDIIKRFDDERIILLDRKNKGLIESLNEGLEVCKGDYIARMDADDISHPKRFERQLRAFLDDQELVLCSGGIVAFSENEFQKKRYYPVQDSDLRSEFIYNSSIVHPLSMFDANIVRVNGLKFDSEFKYCEDYKFFYELSKFGSIKNLPYFLLKYRIHPLSQTNVGTKNKEDRFVKISRIHALALKDIGLILNSDQMELHYMLSLSSEISIINFDKYSVENIITYGNYLVDHANFNNNFKITSLKSTIGERFLKICLFNKRRLRFMEILRLISHPFTLRAGYNFLNRIIKYHAK